MPDKKLKIVYDEGTFDIKLENLSGKAEPRKVNGKEIQMKRDGSPVIIRKTNTGKKCEFTRVDTNGTLIGEVSNAYLDEDGQIHQEGGLMKYYVAEDGEEMEATKNEKTEVFQISKYEPLEAYLDKYQMDSYHQIKPGQGESKKDYARKLAIQANTVEMKKLWDRLDREQVVGRGILNLTSNGWLPSVAYVRAVKVNGTKWTLEVAVFKQAKRFTWIEEMDFRPSKVEAPKPVTANQVEDI